ncbi:MAG: endolytic transglycosylase MltG [Chloroflexota bacterium]|nr:endolytic transglycosylase MltG [Chloroflexota bacterium]
MPKKNKPSHFISVGLVIIFLVSIVLIAGLLMMRATVIKRFGQPAQDLNLIQRVIYSFELFVNRDVLTEPIDSAGNEMTFDISQGESVALICLRMEQAGLIGDAESMRIYLVYTGLDRQLQSGQFMLTPAESPIEIASQLLDITPKDAVVTILPGWRIEEVAANIASSGLAISEETFISAAYAPNPGQISYLPDVEIENLEGYLYPGTYVFPLETGLNDVMNTFLKAFSHNVDSVILEGCNRQGLSLEEAVILASIIEKEAVIDDEKPLIASVFFNRISQGMRLETDPTVQYALGYQSATQTWWKSPLNAADVSIESPYNTYHVFGMPPAPICNPGLDSLQAVAFPAETPYFYFRAACDGSGRHNFAITFEEHLNNSCEE